MRARYFGVIGRLVCTLSACASPDVPEASPDASGAAAESSGATTSDHLLAGTEAWIAYQTNRGGGEGVWLIHPDGTDDHEIALDVPDERLHPDWSPDGTRLVVTSRGAKDTLYEVDVDTDESRVLWACEADCLGDDEAVWSPDGSQIAFVRAIGPIQNDAPADCSLWLGDPETGQVQQLTSTPGCTYRETFPHWSRDGTRIAYYRGVYADNGTSTANALYVLDVATGQETKLTDDTLFAGDSDWSANDEWLVFSSYPLNDFQCCEVSNLYRINPDGTGLEQLTDYTNADVRATQPRYTPDSDSIIFTAVADGSRELWVMPAEGGEPIVVSAGGIYTHGTWQPGGGD